MMFRATVIALLASIVSAKTIHLTEDTPADAAFVHSLLRHASVVEPSRHLNNNNNNDNQRDQSFIANYSIKYLGCSSLTSIPASNGNNNNNKNKNSAGLVTQNLIRFALCPGTTCGSCTGGGEYVVTMNQFVDAYTEAKMEQTEWECEQIRENCVCADGYDAATCETTCYAAANMSDCENVEGGNDFEIQRYLECAELKGQGGNNNNNNGNAYQYYIAPVCQTDGKSITMQIFTDYSCTQKGDNSVWETMYYQELPFSKTSMVKAGDCVSCIKNDNRENNGNNNNGYQAYEASELCTNSWYSAVKCESKMDVSYADTTGCDYIHNVLPKIENAAKKVSSKSGSGSSSGPAKAFAWVFGFTTVLFGAYAYFLYRKIKRGSVSLVNSGSNMGD